MFPCVYEIMSDGEERAKITNQLFDKLDGWIRETENSASTTYGREIYANNLLCIKNEYKAKYERAPRAGMRYDQSLYSSVLLEETVCAGYTMAFCAMMNALDIDTTAGISVNHAWNVVHFDDGNYYAVDVCWNDGGVDPPYSSEYLNVGEEIMTKSNSRNESHTYSEYYAAWIPAIAKGPYIPTKEELDLDAPQNVRTDAFSAASILLSWDAVPDASKYRIERYEDSTHTKVAEFTTTEKHTCSFDKLQPDTTYYFGVCACLPATRESYSDWTYFSQKTGPDEGSTQPVMDNPFEKLYTKWSGTDKARTTWSALADLARGGTYEVCQYTDSTYTEMAEGYPRKSKADKNHIWTGLESGKTYYFGVRVVKTLGGKTTCSHWMKFSYTHTEAS